MRLPRLASPPPVLPAIAAICAAALGLAAGGPGCVQAGYVLQAAHGQLDLRARARPLDRAVRDRRTPGRVAALLAEVPEIKRFGEAHGLSRTRNYETYVALDRPAAVWVVSACEPLRFRSRTWRFPIVGGVPYLGWFRRTTAERFAARLRARGWDVDLRRAAAYSTLGWFRDSVLSTMIREGDDALGELANIVLHESVHATVFVKGQTHFNENVASFLGDGLARAYVLATRGETSVEARAYLRALEEDEARARAYTAAYVRLAALYDDASIPEPRKRSEKARVLDEVSWRLQTSRPVNNATLMEFRAYGSGRAELQSLLDACGGRWPCLVDALRSVGPRAFARPNQEEMGPVIAPLVERVRSGRRSP